MINIHRTLAVFDFDHTLVTGDSFWPFLIFTAGFTRVAAVLIESLIACAWHYAWHRNRQDSSARTFIKARMLQRLLAGRKVASLDPAIARLRRWLTWCEPMRQELMQHAARGHHIVIASGALDLYLPELVRDLPHAAIIATQMEVVDGKLTGAMLGGNCVRRGKAQRIKDYMAQHGPFADSWAYGNYPHDVPMMELVRYRVIV